ncbi:MAG: roadblock/LC7 domain-containing protein [Candidatus Hodarchaeota archaeon]
MSISSTIRFHLDELRSINGVENIFLAQRDGYPITSAGVWFSNDEIFGISAAASAIYAVARRLYTNLNYALVEGEQAKFLIVAFPNNSNFFLSLTTRTNVNLGAIIHSLHHCTTQIYPHLFELGSLPPLRSYTPGQEASILDRFKAQDKPLHSPSPRISHQSLVLTNSMVTKLRALLSDFMNLLDGAHPTFISLNGGYPITPKNQLDPNISALSAFTFALYDTCKKVGWITKRTNIYQVVIDSGPQHHFIYNTGSSIFSTTLQKVNSRLGYLRLLIPTFTTRIEETLTEATQPVLQPQAHQPIPTNRFLEGFLSPFQPPTQSS